MGAPIFSLATSLVVPVDVAAFCVGADDVAGTVDGAPSGTQYFAGTTPDFSKLPYLRNGDYGSNERLNLSEVVLAAAQPFSQVSEPLRPGVHLHWALPDTLTHGVAAGAGATAVATVAGGQVTGVTVTGGGSGYTYPPAVVLTGTGTGATAYATVNPAGELVAVSVTNGGTNYTTPPTVTLQPALGFPEAPNRWAVVRIVANATTGATSHRAWVVESDRLWDATPGQAPSGPNSASIAVPVRPSPTNTSDNQAFRQQGWVTPLPEWSEPTGAPAVERLTALGYGDVAYAASYRSCHNVFGFWDALDDLGSAGSGYDKDRPDDARLSYLVMGWHNSPGSDPLATLGTGNDFAAEMAARLAWSVSSLPEGSPRPVQSVYHGLVRAITWDAGHTYVGPKTGAPLEVALGNNLPEALAALLATELTGQANLERVLCALQLGVLSQLDVTGALPAGRLADFEEALHASEFKPSPGGTLWLVKRSEPAGAGGGATASGLTEAAAQLGVTLPDELAAKLNRLNSAQQELDELSGEIGSMRDQIFADWYKYMCLQWAATAPASPGSTALPAQPDQVEAGPAREFIASEVAALEQLLLRFSTLAGPTPPTGTGDGGILYQRQQLEEALAATGSNGYQLTSVSAPRYWQPNDPVMLIAGPDALAPARHGQDGRDQPDNTLRCRLGTDVIDAMHVGDGAGSAVSAGDVLALASPGGSGLDGTLQALLAEAYFVDPDRAWLLSRALSRRGGAIGLDQAIAAAQQRLLATGASPGTTPETAPTITFAGAAPSPIGVNAWSGNPWLPLSLEWEVNYVDPLRPGPAPGPAYRTDYLSTNFAWGDDDIDLVFEGAVPPALPAGETYRGAVALSGNADINLRGQLSRYLDSDPKSEYAGQLAALIKLPALPMLAQSLSGFNEALVMRRQTLQVPVSDPLAIKTSRILSQFSNVTVANAVQDRNRTAPLPHNAYNPFRAGFMQLTRARLVDAFGQFRDIDVSKVMAAESMRAPGGSTAIVLPPRLSQPSRLLFRWLSADDDQVEMNTHPATTPICGWVLFNHVDDALMIYDAAGVPMASLNVRGALCRGAPGSQASFTTPCSEIFEHANPHLRDFVASITGREPLAELLSAIDRSVTTIDPANSKQDTGLSVLIGRPLAIVRGSLSLDLAGLPALDQSWASFASAVAATSGPGGPGDGYDPARRDVAAFTTVDVGVQLGDPSDVDDGLVGYFVSAPNGPGNTTFYAPAADVGGTGFVKQPTRTTLRAHAGGGERPLLLTMLVDPRAPVHASTGILPVKAIDIPPDMYADALGNLAVTFQVAPVMSPASGVELPLPTEAGFTWSWLSTSLTGWSEGALATPNLKAVFSDPPQQLHEGWLKLARAPVPSPAGKGPSATNFVLEKEPGQMTDLIAGAAPAGLQFAVQNAQGRPVVYLGGQEGQNDLRVTMSNLTGGSLALRGGAAVAEPPGASGPTSFYLTFDFLNADQLALTAVSAAGWLAVRQAGPPQCWALTPAQDLTLGAGEPVELTVTGISPSGRPRPGTVAVDFYNVPGLSDDTWEATVLVQNPPNDQKALQLTPEMDSSVVFISVDADHTVRNELTWSLSNPQPDAPLVADNTPWGAQPPMFTVSFVYSGPPGYGALTTADRAAQVQLSPGEPYADNWVVTPQQQGPKTYWTLEPANHEVLGAGASATVEFKFTDIVTFLRPGLTQMYVQYANIPGYADGYLSFSLRKVVPMTITSLEVEPAWAEAATLPQAVSLSWALQGDGWVELQSTDGLDMANPANPYPVPAVAHPVRFTLRATPKEQGPPAVAQTTFNVVTFTPNQAPVWLWGPANSGGCPTTGLVFSARWDKAYVTGLNPGDGTTLMWAVDLASGNYDQVQLSAGEPALTAAVTLGGGDAEHERLYVAITSPGGSILAVDVTADGQATVAHVLGLSFSVQNYAPFCVSPNGRFIYAGVSGGIVSYDTADSFAKASVCGGSAIEALAVSPDGTRLYVLGDGCGSLTVVDLVSRQVLSSLSTGGGRTGDYPRLAAHPDGKHVFATGVKTAALTTIRLADNSVQSVPVTGVSNLCDVQISPDGRLVCVACSDAGTAAVIDPVANVVKEVWDDTSRSTLDAFDQTNAVGFKPDGQTIGILRSQAGGGRLSLVQCAWEPLRQSR